MHTNDFLAAIDAQIDASRDALTEDIFRLVRIPSVQGDPLPGAPFGAGPRAMLDEVLRMAQEDGFAAEDHGVGVIHASLREGQPDLGIWLHGDVVPEGDGWNFPPYEPTLTEGCVIGRGSADNKGQLAAIYRVLKIFRDLNIPLQYNPALYVCSNEETGMADLCGLPGNPDARGFVHVCTPPRLSLVPDGGFPLGYGGKGSMKLQLRSRNPLQGIALSAGQPDSPGTAEAILDRVDIPDTLPACTVAKGEKTTVSAYSPPRHGAHPDPNGNMITMLCTALLDTGLCTGEDRRTLDFLCRVSKDTVGAMFGINIPSAPMPPLTVFAGRIDNDGGHVILHLNIRYPLGITYEEIVQRIADAADADGFDVYDSKPGQKPYLADPDTPAARILREAAREVTGSDAAPFLLSGGTYAHCLPNAYVFGMSSNQPPRSFPAGRGGAHGVDEAVSLDRLQRGMKIYARALLALNHAEW